MGYRIVAAVTTALLAYPGTAHAGQIPPGATYVYPPQARALPALNRWFATDAAKTYPKAPPPAAGDRDGAPLGCDDSCIQRWQTVADTPRFLSLSFDTTEQGGTHPLIWSGSMVWDKAMAVPRPALSFFINSALLDDAVRPAFCRLLADERREKRGRFEGGGFASWKDCVDPATATLMLGAAHRHRFDRLGFRMDPYVAGAYAEGTYEVTLPVTPAILAAVKPEWRRYFVVAGTP